VANPAGLALLALAIPIVLLHVLRPRRPQVAVSSTYLWRSMAKPVSAATPWQRLRFSWLLLLQLLAVLLLALAVAKPVRVTAAPLAPHTVFIIDASGSMAATDGHPDRLADAKAKAKSLRRQLPAGGVASVVVAGARPFVALTSSPDPAAFRSALDSVQANAGKADFATAFTLAASLETPAAPVGFVLISDGGLDDADARLVPAGTRFVPVGSRAANRGIRTVAVSPRGSGLHVRVTIRNEGGAATTQNVRVDVDGRTAAQRRVRLPERTTVEQDFDVRTGDHVEAFLEGEDLLAADNHAFAAAARRRPLKVLLAGPDDPFLTRLLAAMPGVTVERSATARPAPEADLAIYDQVAVPAEPGTAWLAIAPPGGVPDLPARGEVERPAVTLVQPDDPLTRGLDLSTIAIAKAQKVEAASDSVVVGSDTTALLVRGTRKGQPFAYLTFPLSASNLPLNVAFPILGDRLVSLLAAQALPAPDVRVGQPLPVAGTKAVTVETPLTARIQVPAGGSPPIADRPGFWTVHEQGKPDRSIAVNADPAESKVAPLNVPVPADAAATGGRRPHGEVPLTRWVIAALLVVLAAELLLSLRARGVSRRQWRAAMVLRTALALLLLAALVDLRVPRVRHRVATMFLIDASDSMGAAGRSEAVAWVRDALKHQRGSDVAGVAFFGGDARIESSVQGDVDLVDQSVKVDATRTNLAGGLRLAAAVLPDDARRRIVVVSDGRATTGDAAGEVGRLRSRGVRVEVHPVERASGPDAAVTRVDAPGTVHRGDTVGVRATIEANQAMPARVTLDRDGTVVEERTVDLKAGENQVDFAVPAGDPGTVRYRVSVAAASDTIPEDNAGYAATHVEGAARVLLAEGMKDEAAPLAAALRASGMEVDVAAAAALPALDKLSGYAATVLVDVDAGSLAPEQVAALAASTKDLGHGLVAVGGDRSYALGGYLDSELEKLLPVVSEIKDPKRRASVAEVLAIDSSGSMAACHCRSGDAGMRDGGGVVKTDIARTAAGRAIASLSKSDQVGVLAFNTQQQFVIPLQQVPADDVVQKGLRGLKPEGGTDLLIPLQRAGDELRKAKAKLKHIILFTDGFTAQQALAAMVDQAAGLAREGITVSVMATGEGASEQLRAVAEAGKGRFYPGRDLSEIPRLMVQEAVLASRNFINEGTFFPKVVGSDPVVAGLTSSPALLGYVATTAKPTAGVQLSVGDDEDPLLATWQVGLGRATSWTSDTAARWSKHWATWDGYVGFWSAVVKGVLPGGSGAASVRSQVQGDRLRVTVESEAAFADGTVADARVFAPDGTETALRLDRTSDTTFVGEVAASVPGAYAVGVALTGGAALSGIAIQSYSPEYKPGPADAAGLVRLSRATGGRGAIKAAQAFDAAGLPAGRGRVALAGWLLLLAALAWPVDVALRRLALRRRMAVPEPAVASRSAGGEGRVDVSVDGGVEPVDVPVPEPVVIAANPSLGRLLDRKRAQRDEPAQGHDEGP
jgi:Mg-chelatase subunit ChlD/uncharacterized membrane protein